MSCISISISSSSSSLHCECLNISSVAASGARRTYKHASGASGVGRSMKDGTECWLPPERERNRRRLDRNRRLTHVLIGRHAYAEPRLPAFYRLAGSNPGNGPEGRYCLLSRRRIDEDVGGLSIARLTGPPGLSVARFTGPPGFSAPRLAGPPGL